MCKKFDFSFDSYGRLLGLFRETAYSCTDYFNAPDPNLKILLRHDIDIDIYNCEPLSDIELSNGFSSTWFFQPNNDYYNPLSSDCMRILRKISERHTLGLHIDPVLFPDAEQLEKGVRQIYDFYSNYFNIKKVFSFHRPAKYLEDPSLPLNGFVNAYSHSFSDVMTYVSDSNRRMFFEQDRIWDAYSSRKSVILLTHPLWWREKSLEPEQLYEHMIKRTEYNICRKALADNITLYGKMMNKNNEV